MYTQIIELIVNEKKMVSRSRIYFFTAYVLRIIRLPRSVPIVNIRLLGKYIFISTDRPRRTYSFENVNTTEIKTHIKIISTCIELMFVKVIIVFDIYYKI